MAFAAPIALEAAEAGGAAAGGSRLGSFLNAAKRMAPFGNSGGGEGSSAPQPSIKESAETSVAAASSVLRAGNL